jgi:hypothetical protein
MMRLVWWALVVFGVFYLVTSPVGAAGLVHGLLHDLDDAARSLCNG